MKKSLTLLLLVTILFCSLTTALAETHQSIIEFPNSRTNLTYGPSIYHKKISGNSTWKGGYSGGASQHTSINIYLYDQQLGDRGTHIEPVTKGAGLTTFDWLGRSGNNNRNYKVVLILPSHPGMTVHYLIDWDI